MVEWFSRHRRARTVLLVVVGGVVGVAVLGLVLAALGGSTSRDRVGERPVQLSPDWAAPAPSTGGTPAPSPEAADAAKGGPPPRLASLPDTDDPDAYAAAVAQVVFGMDYTSHGPGDYEAFFEAALWDELTDDARAGVAATMGMRIPSPDMWDQMRSVEQTSEFDVELVWEPRAQAELDADPGVPDGVVIRNVTGAQTETWLGADGQQQTSARPVTVSLAVVCPPAASPCVLGGIFPNVES